MMCSGNFYACNRPVARGGSLGAKEPPFLNRRSIKRSTILLKKP